MIHLPRNLIQRLKNAATAPLVLLAALFIVFEELLWDRLAAAFGLLARWPVWARLERWIAGLPAWAAMPLFLVPMLLLFPIKLAALWLMAHHHVFSGLQLILVAKIAGTAVAARLFMLLKPTLLGVPWFARLYYAFVSWRSRVFARLHAMIWWQAAQAVIERIRRQIAKQRAGSGLWQSLKRRAMRWRRKKSGRS